MLVSVAICALMVEYFARNMYVAAAFGWWISFIYGIITDFYRKFLEKYDATLLEDFRYNGKSIP